MSKRRVYHFVESARFFVEYDFPVDRNQFDEQDEILWKLLERIAVIHNTEIRKSSFRREAFRTRLPAYKAGSPPDYNC